MVSAPLESIERPDLLGEGGDKLQAIERLQVAAIRRSFEPGRVDNAIRWCQRSIGTTWITLVTDKLRHTHNVHRLPRLTPSDSVICVCNHRSFFDLYVVTTDLIRRGLKQRIVFPVRSKFFYDNPLGFFVNGAMSFFAMYPPIFRERERAFLNVASLRELAWLLRRGGTFVGIHPEGTRNRSNDPYTLLPAHSGVGRLIRHARVPVIPVFTNGLLPDNLTGQVISNFNGTGVPIHTVFGSAIDFGGLLEEPPSPRLYKRIAERALKEVAALGEEEREIRRLGLAGSNEALP